VDKRIQLSIVFQYLAKNKPFDKKVSVLDEIKKETKWFSYLRSELRYTIFGLLITNFADPCLAVKQLTELYESLPQQVFKKEHLPT
jgi:hypothetical protein